jgi:hypothetical protein
MCALSSSNKYLNEILRERLPFRIVDRAEDPAVQFTLRAINSKWDGDCEHMEEGTNANLLATS